MNNVYENNMRLLPFLKFVETYKRLIIFLSAVVIIGIGYFVISNQIYKQKNEEAAVIYEDLEGLFKLGAEDNERIDEILENLLINYRSTGYTQLALLNKASLDANNNKLQESLENFKTLINITDGRNGNKIYNKMARISAARILLSQNQYDEALNMIEMFSTDSNNGYIHELIGDILVKQNKIELARVQYQMASDKYSDEMSKSIISMKMANIGN
tara:strand:+ start:658 stop:1302 length:645 start_codon:yes stop_codon:yes gene_type:complete